MDGWIYSRRRHSIVGDGNCLFRSFSFILFEVESKHFDIRKLLVQANLVFPVDPHFTLTTDKSHIEICHIYNNHYDAVLNDDGSIPKTLPYSGTTSSSLAVDSIVIT